MAIEVEDLAKLVMGIANAQKTVVMGLAQGNPQITMQVIRALQGASGVGRTPQPEPTFEDLPARVLLQVMGNLQPAQHEALHRYVEEQLRRLTE